MLLESSNTQTWSKVQQASGRLTTSQLWYKAGHTIPAVEFESALEIAPVSVAVGVAVVAGMVGMKDPEAVVWQTTGRRRNTTSRSKILQKGGRNMVDVGDAIN
jgi:hypothetical protein